MRSPAAIGTSGMVNQGSNMGGQDPSSALRLTLLVCLAEIFGLSSMGVFPSLLPTFQREWGLSHTEAGWISAAYYAGYMALVPLLSSVTDRIDARRIMGIGAICRIVGAVAYALLAQGFGRRSS